MVVKSWPLGSPQHSYQTSSSVASSLWRLKLTDVIDRHLYVYTKLNWAVFVELKPSLRHHTRYDGRELTSRLTTTYLIKTLHRVLHLLYDDWSLQMSSIVIYTYITNLIEPCLWNWGHYAPVGNDMMVESWPLGSTQLTTAHLFDYNNSTMVIETCGTPQSSSMHVYQT